MHYFTQKVGNNYIKTYNNTFFKTEILINFIL